MVTKLTWHGHGTWSIQTEQHKLLLDPFFTNNPSADCTADEVEADVILLSHGHMDHVGDRGDGTFDVVEIAKRTGAQVLTSFELANWLQGQGVENVVGMNLGGTFRGDFGSAKMVTAHHSSSLPDGSYAGNPAGFVLTLGSRKIYFACDTALFSDMRLIGELGIDLAVIPIGDLFTMGIEDSIAAIKLINPSQVAPAHYGTWPPIEQDAPAWAAKVRNSTNATPHVLQPGGAISLS